MAYELLDLLEQVGEAGDLVGGAVIARLNNKNVELGRIDLQTGAFNLSPAGVLFMKGARAKLSDAVSAVPAPVRRKKVAPVVVETDDLLLD